MRKIIISLVALFLLTPICYCQEKQDSQQDIRKVTEYLLSNGGSHTPSDELDKNLRALNEYDRGKGSDKLKLADGSYTQTYYFSKTGLMEEFHQYSDGRQTYRFWIFEGKSKKCYGLGEVIGGVPSPDKVCCAGLVLRDMEEDFDENCQSRGAAGYAGICLACGDGVCDKRYENKCNCPEDCAKGSIKK